LTPRKTGSGRR